MKCDLAKKWETLQKCLDLELTLQSKEMKRALKNFDYVRCHELKIENSTVAWVISEIESILETGEVL